MYQIDAAVPLPKKAQDQRLLQVKPLCMISKYPFRFMKVGESFYVKPEKGETVREVAKRLCPRVSRECRGGKKFVTRKCLDGLRIWRVR